MVKRKSSFRGKVASNARRQKSAGASYGYLNLPKGVSVYTAEPGGKARFDIMPYKVTDGKHPDRDDELGIAMQGELWYKRPFRTHRNIGASDDTVVCLTSVGKRCPICEYRALQIKDGADKDITDALKPSLRNLYVIIPKDDKKREEIPHIWDISQYLFQNLLTDELEENEDYEVFPDLEEGLTLRVRFDSTTIGSGKPFAEANRIDFEERKKAYKEDILEDIPNLDDILVIMSAEALERKFFEMEDASDTPEEVDKPSKQRPGKERDEDEGDELPAARKRPQRSAPESTPEPPPASDTKKKPDKNACVSCEGTGKDSKGRTCRICRGTGQKPASKESADEKNKCPHGHKFGVDAEEYDACFDCEMWDACMDEKEKNE